MCLDLEELHLELYLVVGRLRQKPRLIRSFFVEAGLEAQLKHLITNIFGMFVALGADQVLKKNISLIAKHVWSNADDRVKYRIGIKLDGYRTNLQQDRAQEGIEFLKLVDGRMYESLSSKIITPDNLLDKLEEDHMSYNNYWREPPIMREILQFSKSSADIPREVVPKLAKVIMRCRIGRGLSYRTASAQRGVHCMTASSG